MLKPIYLPGLFKTAGGSGSSQQSAAIRHDAGEKIFSTRFDNIAISPADILQDGNTTVASTLKEVESLVNIIFSKIETAKHICRKLYRFLFIIK